MANRFDDQDTIFIKRTLQAELPELLRNQICDELFREIVTSREKAFVDELYINMDQSRTMWRHRMAFAIHGYDHYWMNRLSKRELHDDLTQALDVFDGVIDPGNWTNCYPYGSCDDSVIRISKELGKRELNRRVRGFIQCFLKRSIWPGCSSSRLSSGAGQLV